MPQHNKDVLLVALEFAEEKLLPRPDAMLICRIKPRSSVVSSIIHGILHTADYDVSRQTVFRRSSELAHMVLNHGPYENPAQVLKAYLSSDT